jgi:uncharacterized protein (TIGR02466 family)
MPQFTPDENGFLALWPTQFLQRQLPNAETANDVLAQIIVEQESAYGANAAAGDLSSDYLSQDFLSIDHPVIAWLKACINKSIGDYLHQQGMEYTINWGLQAWPNINRRGDYHNLHNHPHSYLSGTYYVSMPAADEFDSTARSDLNPGSISFFDPRAQANMLAIKGDGQVDAEYRVYPKAGMLLLWPAFLHHLVHPNLSDDLRISISFNVVLKWRDDYIP